MSTPYRSVAEYMTPAPHTIDRHEPLGAARRQMDRLGIRHLPVVDGGKPIGLLAARDLYVLTGIHEVDFAKATVDFGMNRQPYCVPEDMAVEEVARHLCRRKIGSALVVDGGGLLVGIFTEADCAKVLAGGI